MHLKSPLTCTRRPRFTATPDNHVSIPKQSIKRKDAGFVSHLQVPRNISYGHPDIVVSEVNEDRRKVVP